MSKIQKIKLKRTQKTLAQLGATTLDFGEPLYVKDSYFLLGKADSSAVSSNKVLKFQDQVRIDKGVFYTGTAAKTQLTDDEGVNLYPLTTADNVSYGNSNLKEVIDDILDPDIGVHYAESAGTAENSNLLKTRAGTSTNYYLLGVADVTNDNYKVAYHAGPNSSATKNTTGVYYTASGVLMSAAWNDYAEGRACDGCTIPGTCMVEDGHGRLIPSTDYLQPVAGIVSDTYGMYIGAEYTDSKPIAVAGRVLAYVKKDGKLKVGDALKSAPGGVLERMTRREIRKYPDRIAGIVSEFPTYDKWQDISVDGRIWVKIR